MAKAKRKRITTKSGKCKWGRVKTGERKGQCRTRKLSGAAKGLGQARIPHPGKGPKKKRRGAAFKKGRTSNVVGKKATGTGRFCVMKRTDSGKSTTRCYREESGALSALQRMIGGRQRYRSVMLYSKKAR